MNESTRKTMNENTRELIAESHTVRGAVMRMTDHLDEMARLARLEGDDAARVEFLAISEAMLEMNARITKAVKAHLDRVVVGK